MMTINRYLRLIAGSFVLASVVLGYLVSPWFLVFTGFVALNLMQSAFTNTCPMVALLRKLGVRDDTKALEPADGGPEEGSPSGPAALQSGGG